ncbi:hypothetical protein [Acidihalobacter prosperus]
MNHFQHSKGESAEPSSDDRPVQRLPDRSHTEAPTHAPWPAKLRLEVDARTLLRLLRSDALCAAELRCLDRHSHAVLRRLCLQACMHARCRLSATCEAAARADDDSPTEE